MKEPTRIVRKSGNSLVVGITQSAIEILKLEEGDILREEVKGKRIIITKIKKGDK